MFQLLLRPRCASKANRPTQIQIPLRVFSPFFRENKRVKSSHTGVERDIVKVDSSANLKLQVPEIKNIDNYIVRFWDEGDAHAYAVVGEGDEQYQLLSSILLEGIASGNTGMTVPRKPSSSSYWRIIEDSYFSEYSNPRKLSPTIDPVLLNIRQRHAEEVAGFINRQTAIRDGFIYVVENDAWPGVIKIGCTIDYVERLSSYQTNSPRRDYKMVLQRYVSDRRLVEANLKAFLRPVSVSDNERNEWFRASPEDVRRFLDDRFPVSVAA